MSLKIKPPILKQPTWSLEDFYYHIVPTKTFTKKHFEYHEKTVELSKGITYEQYLKATSEHDAIHYLMNLEFSKKDESKVVTVEMHCNVGWWALNPKFNTFEKDRIKFQLPEGLGKTLITETAEKLRSLY